MLCFSSESLKYSEDLSATTTIRRAVDITYRLHMGAITFAVESVKVVGQPEFLVRIKLILTSD